jgi:hypothetical protein
LKINKETKWKQRAKISSYNCKVLGRNIIKFEYYGRVNFAHFIYHCIQAQAKI